MASAILESRDRPAGQSLSTLFRACNDPWQYTGLESVATQIKNIGQQRLSCAVHLASSPSRGDALDGDKQGLLLVGQRIVLIKRDKITSCAISSTPLTAPHQSLVGP